jgi:hypothetical protein
VNPFAFAGVIAALVAAARSSQQQESATPFAPEAALAVVLWLLVGPVWVLQSMMLIDALLHAELLDAAQAFGLWALATVVLFPWPIARLWLIPRGHARLAWMVTRLSFWVWRRDVAGGALIASSWALARAAQRGVVPSPRLVASIERRLGATSKHSKRWTLGGAGIVAAGLLAEARHDRVQARRLIASAGELAEPTWPRAAIQFAWEWLCAEAMTRGAWREVEFLGRTAPVESRSLAFIGSVAARLTGIAPLPNDLLLQWRWFAAPRRLATRELLRRAVAAPATARKVDDRLHDRPAPALPDGSPLLAAMTLHAHSLAGDPKRVTRAEVARLAQLWDAALEDPRLGQQIEGRGEALGSHASLRSSETLADSVREDLLAMIRAANLDLGALGDESELLGRAARRLHGELLDGLEVAIGALESRVEATRALPAIDEWQSFLSVREQYAEAVSLGGLPLRRLAFSTVHGPVCGLAVWLWNTRAERAIGNAIFSWLLAEAIIVDDAEAIRLQERNVGCGV